LRLEVIDWARFKGFAERCLELVEENPDYELFRVRREQSRAEALSTRQPSSRAMAVRRRYPQQ
jgi:hypothetical protein